MTSPRKMRVKIFNVAMDGFAFAISEETGETVFISRQLCAAHEITEDDVAREIECLVGDGARGPQASTLTFIEEVEESELLIELRSEIEALTTRVETLEQRLDE